MKISARLSSLGLYFLTGIAAIALALWLASSILKTGAAQDDGTAFQAPEETSSFETTVPTDPVTTEDVQAPPAGETLTASPSPTVVPPEVTFLEPYVYDLREGRRNPFKPPPTFDGSEVAAGTFPGLELERFELDEIKLVAIMWDIKNPKAMFLDPNGQVHTLGKDDRIGRKRGYIAQIREGEVVVVETSSFSGEAVYSTRVLRIDR